MAADEDIELRDLLLEALEKRGVINRVKAELRASVYLALEEAVPSAPRAALLGGEQGRLAASLVHDFLSACGLRFTLSVLEPEAAEEPLSRQELCARLCLEAQRPGPLLLQLLPQAAPPPPAGQARPAGAAAEDQEWAPTVAGPAVGPAASGQPLSAPPQEAPGPAEGEPHSVQSTASRRTEPSGSEESVEEALSHLDDSSLSTTADDHTVDQSVSRSSDLEGCDYAEPAAR